MPSAVRHTRTLRSSPALKSASPVGASASAQTCRAAPPRSLRAAAAGQHAVGGARTAWLWPSRTDCRLRSAVRKRRMTPSWQPE